MRRFAQLCARIAEARSPEAKRTAIGEYFASARADDAACARTLLKGLRPKRVVAPAMLARWAAHASGLSEALAQVSLAHVGDVAEAAALMLDTASVLPGEAPDVGLAQWIGRLAELAGRDEATVRERIAAFWRELALDECIVVNKLAIGTLRLAAPAQSTPAASALAFRGVLMYAQPGHGRRASLCTEYTLGAWSGDALVAVARATSALADHEVVEIDRWVRAHTTRKFGPARAVAPQLVFEVAFDDATRSARRKGGVTLRAPRVVRWLRDTPARDADALAPLVAIAESRS